ncbi:MAG: secretin and TonB N-terminal domain-containing protein [Lentimicrobiaceae bacterium]|jgi:hypothetical protein|nr:secretin and TonB N-terminal domain-containing protein [Lentimicrobiaceae bacterium]
MKQENFESTLLKPKENTRKKRICVSFVTLLLFLFSAPIYAQESLQIDFEAHAISLPAILNKLYVEQKINLAFSSDDMDANKKLSYKAKSKTIEEILNDILLPQGYNFKKIGGQYVIFKDENSHVIQGQPTEKEPVVVEIIPKEKKLQQTMDTVVFQPTYITETIIRIDTIVRVDTIRISDTLIREIPVRDNKSERQYLISTNQRAEKGFSIQITYSQIYTDYTVKARNGGNAIAQRYKEALQPSWQNQSIAVNGIYAQKRLAYSVQLGLTSLRHDFKYANTVVRGDYYRTDTLDMYYSIVDNDTIWVAVTDSTYIPRTENKIDYRSFNKLLMLNSYFDVRYNLIHKPDFKLYAGAGLGFYYVLDYEITVLGFKGEDEEIPLENVDIQKFGFSYNLKLGSQIALSRHVDINAELYYKQSLNLLLKDYPVGVKLFGVGMQIGFIYHFR